MPWLAVKLGTLSALADSTVAAAAEIGLSGGTLWAHCAGAFPTVRPRLASLMLKTCPDPGNGRGA